MLILKMKLLSSTYDVTVAYSRGDLRQSWPVYGVDRMSDWVYTVLQTAPTIDLFFRRMKYTFFFWVLGGVEALQVLLHVVIYVYIWDCQCQYKEIYIFLHIWVAYHIVLTLLLTPLPLLWPSLSVHVLHLRLQNWLHSLGCWTAWKFAQIGKLKRLEGWQNRKMERIGRVERIGNLKGLEVSDRLKTWARNRWMIWSDWDLATDWSGTWSRYL